MNRLRRAAPHMFLLLISIGLLLAVARIDTSSVPEGTLGPAFWPRMIVLFMGLLCIYEILKRLLGAKDQFTGFIERQEQAAELGQEVGSLATLIPSSAPDPEDKPADPIVLPKLLGGIALIAIYSLAIQAIGFFISSAVFIAAFSAIGGFRHLLWNPLTSVLGSLGFFFLFTRVAYISLPLGVGPFKEFSILLMQLMGVR